MAWIKPGINPPKIRAAISLATLLFALPLGWKGASGIFIWLSPFIMLNSVIILKSYVFLNLAGVLVLLASFFRKRFFCSYLCPSGLCLDKISEISRFRASVHRKLPRTGAVLAVISITAAFTGIPLLILLDPQAILHGFLSVFQGKTGVAAIISLAGFPVLLAVNYFLPHIWCGKICPLGGLQDIAAEAGSAISKIRKEKDEERNETAYRPARRYFIAAGAGLAGGAILSGINKAHFNEGWIRPPGSIDPSTFGTLCIRCGNCIKSCPTGILKQHEDFADIISWLTPEVEYTNGYCIEDCNSCSKVCPTGSITLFSKDAKNSIFMGLAKVSDDECLLSKNRECDRCKAACSYKAVEISRKGSAGQLLPEISRVRCVGCGACKVICPVYAIKILPVPAG